MHSGPCSEQGSDFQQATLDRAHIRATSAVQKADKPRASSGPTALRPVSHGRVRLLPSLLPARPPPGITQLGMSCAGPGRGALTSVRPTQCRELTRPGSFSSCRRCGAAGGDAGRPAGDAGFPAGKGAGACCLMWVPGGTGASHSGQICIHTHACSLQTCMAQSMFSSSMMRRQANLREKKPRLCAWL